MPGPAVVELTAVDETPVSVEEEEVRRTRGVVGLRNLLRLIEQIREGVAGFAGFLGEARGGVLRVGLGVVRADRDDREAGVHVIPTELCDPGPHVSHVRAVAADEHHQERRSVRGVGELQGVARDDIGKREVGRFGSQRQHLRLDAHPLQG